MTTHALSTATGTCQMIVCPSHEGSPDIECGKPVSRTWEHVPCCEDCFEACTKQEAIDAEKRAALRVGEGEG